MELAVIIGIYSLMLAVAVVWICGKGGSLLNGYNIMSRKKKATYNEKAMLRFIGIATLIFAFFMALGHISMVFEISWLAYSFIVALAILFGAVNYAFFGKRFRKQADDTSNI